MTPGCFRKPPSRTIGDDRDGVASGDVTDGQAQYLAATVVPKHSLGAGIKGIQAGAWINWIKRCVPKQELGNENILFCQTILGEKVEMATIVWEELKQEGIGWVAKRNVYRTKVPGGWLVRIQGAETDFITFLPDSEHQWM